MTIALRNVTKFPALVKGTNGIDTSVANGVYTFKLNYSLLPESPTVPPSVKIAYMDPDTGVIGVTTLASALNENENIQAIANSTTSIDTVGYWNGAASYALTAFTPYARDFVASASAPSARISLGVFKDAGMYGAVGDSTTDDTGALSSARTAVGTGGYVGLENGKSYFVTSYDNPQGVRWRGDGKIVSAVTGGLWQHNTYADEIKPHIGHENLFSAYSYIGGVTKMPIHVFGDSTVQGGFGEHQSVTQAISFALKARGLDRFDIYNHGVSGTRWEQMDTSAYVGGGGLFFIKYGINDAAYGFSNMVAAMESQLSAIRAAKTVQDLSIIIVGPNATSDSPNWRDERWYESIRGIYAYIARKYDCAFFDTYSMFQNSRRAAGLWMSDDFNDGRAIHPIADMNMWIWGGVIDEFFGAGVVSPFSANLVANEGSTTAQITAAAAPSSFKQAIRIDRALVTDGWPEDGFVRTTHNVDSGALQEFFTYAAGRTRKLTRTANISADGWNRWSGVSETLNLQNSWVNYGSTLRAAYATLSADGIVTVEGVIKSGTTTPGTTIATLPAAMAPIGDQYFIVPTSTGTCQLRVWQSGAISIASGGDATYTSLSGISFVAA